MRNPGRQEWPGRPIRTLVVLLGVLALLPPFAVADVIELKTGQRLEGALKQATPASVSIEVGGQTITFEGEKVRAIYFGAAPPPVAAQPSARDEALKALRGLRSVVDGGITYRDYAPRVSDAKVVVDRYLHDGSDISPAKRLIGDSMGLYVFAGAAWNARITRTSAEIVAHPMIEKCPALQSKLVGMPVTGNAFADIKRGVTISFEIPTIWACAADQLAEAEKLVGGAKP